MTYAIAGVATSLALLLVGVWILFGIGWLLVVSGVIGLVGSLIVEFE